MSNNYQPLNPGANYNYPPNNQNINQPPQQYPNQYYNQNPQNYPNNQPNQAYPPGQNYQPNPLILSNNNGYAIPIIDNGDVNSRLAYYVNAKAPLGKGANFLTVMVQQIRAQLPFSVASVKIKNHANILSHGLVDEFITQPLVANNYNVNPNVIRNHKLNEICRTLALRARNGFWVNLFFNLVLIILLTTTFNSRCNGFYFGGAQTANYGFLALIALDLLVISSGITQTNTTLINISIAIQFVQIIFNILVFIMINNALFDQWRYYDAYPETNLGIFLGSTFIIGFSVVCIAYSKSNITKLLMLFSDH